MSARIKPSLEAQRELSRRAADADISLVLPAESAAAEHPVAAEMQILVATHNGLEMKCFQYCRQ